jgi:hypothetical protein
LEQQQREMSRSPPLSSFSPAELRASQTTPLGDPLDHGPSTRRKTTPLDEEIDEIIKTPPVESAIDDLKNAPKILRLNTSKIRPEVEEYEDEDEDDDDYDDDDDDYEDEDYDDEEDADDHDAEEGEDHHDAEIAEIDNEIIKIVENPKKTKISTSEIPHLNKSDLGKKVPSDLYLNKRSVPITPKVFIQRSNSMHHVLSYPDKNHVLSYPPFSSSSSQRVPPIDHRRSKSPINQYQSINQSSGGGASGGASRSMYRRNMVSRTKSDRIIKQKNDKYFDESNQYNRTPNQALTTLNPPNHNIHQYNHHRGGGAAESDGHFEPPGAPWQRTQHETSHLDKTDISSVDSKQTKSIQSEMSPASSEVASVSSGEDAHQTKAPPSSSAPPAIGAPATCHFPPPTTTIAAI